MALDLAAASRQDLDTGFSARDVSTLLAGRLTMSPHPEWLLPEKIDWTADPFDDNNWRHQYQMLRWLEPLRRAASLADADAYDMWIRYARNWYQNNPPTNPLSPYAWRDMVDGIRAIQLCTAVPVVARRSPEDLGWLEESIRDHARWLVDEGNLGHSNHAFHQHQALFVCARVLRDQQMTDLAVGRLDALLAAQYDDQGVNAEGAIAYHCLNLLWWQKLLQRLDLEDIERPAAAKRLRLAAEELAHATRPDGTFVTIGDTDNASAARINHPYTRYVTTAGARGEPPIDLLKVYDAGYVFGRSGWGETERDLAEETFFSISFGSSRRVHGHPDGGSLTYTGDTVNWLVDPGKFQYGESAARTHFLSRAAHNVVAIEGRSLRRNATVRLTHKTVAPRHWEFTVDDDSFEDVTLRRRIVYSTAGEYLVVVDTVRAPEDVAAIQRWQLAPGVEADVDRSRLLLRQNDHHATLAFAGTKGELSLVHGRVDPFDGWVSTGWKQKAAATAVTYRKTGTSFRFITVIATGKSAPPDVRALRGGPEKSIFLEVSTQRLTEQIALTPHGVQFPSPVDERWSVSGTAARPSPAQAGASESELSPQARRTVLAAVAAARAAGSDHGRARRQELATELLQIAHDTGVTDDIDLGVRACVTDLRGEIRGKQDPKIIDPHRTALANWDGSTDWFPTFYDMPVVTSQQAGHASARPDRPSIRTTTAGPLLVPFAVDPAPGTTLTVLFHGAIDRAKTRNPMFQRWTLQTSLDVGPTMAFADPTLDLSASLRLGWYLGTEAVDLAPVMADVIADTADALGAKSIVLVGNSGGGFAALHVGAHLPGAAIMAISPQTDLARYTRRLAEDGIRAALGTGDVYDPALDRTRLSVMDRYGARAHFPRVHLVSNVGDEHHTDRHEAPLRDAYLSAGESAQLTVGSHDLGPGHRSVPTALYEQELRELLRTQVPSTGV